MKRYVLAVGLVLAMHGLLMAQPLAPTGLSASTLSSTTVVLTWTDASSNETGFQIERSSAPASGFSLLASVAANATTYINTGLSAGVTYYYRVRSINSGGSSAYTQVATATTGMRRFLIDFGSPTMTSPSSSWNNVTTPATGTNVNLVESSGIASSVSLQIVKDPSNGYGAFSSNGSNVVVLDYPVSAATDGHFIWQSGGSYRLNGLDQSKAYSLRMFSSRLYVGDSRRSVFTINGQQQVLDATNNTSQTVQFTNVVPVSGSITIQVTVASGSAFGYLNVLDVVEMSVAPATPTNVVATAVSTSQVNVSWTDVANETGFQVERSSSPGSGFVLLATTPANVTAFQDTGLAAGSTHYYRVRAVGAQGNSAYSAEASATTPIPVPAAPADLFADVVSPYQIQLDWTDRSDNESGFQVERSLTTGSGFVLVATLPPNSVSFSSGSLAPDTRYFFRVRAINSGGSSSYSEEVNARTYQVAPAAVANASATAIGPYQVKIDWTDASLNEDEFIVERSTDAVAFVRVAALPANSSSFTDDSVMPATGYFYRVAASNVAGASPYSSLLPATTPTLPPTAPYGAGASSISSSRIQFTWIDASDNETSFVVERSASVNGPFVAIATTEANTTGYLDSLLNSSTVYYYRIFAQNAGGASAYSPVVSATTWQGPPAAPSELAATAMPLGKVRLSWKDNASNETGFVIDRSAMPEGVSGELVVLGADTKEWTDESAEPASNYSYRVRAINDAGSSAGIEATISTWPLPPAAPQQATASARSSSQIQLTWIDASENETHFKVERAIAGGWLSFVLPSNTTSWTDADLTPGTTYSYRLSAMNAGGESSYPAEIFATTLQAPPSAPTALTATGTSPSQILLSWTDASTNETGFEIERSSLAGTGYTAVVTVAANATSYTDNGLTENTTYYYRIRAASAVGASAYTAEASASTQSTTQPYGTIFQETSFASATRFPIAGTGIARGTNKLTMTGNPTLFSSYIYHDDASNPFRYTCLENWKVRARVKTPSTLNSTSYGIGIGVQSTNTADPYSSVMRWSWETGGNQVYLYYKSSISLQLVSTTKYVPAANTYYWVEVTRAKDSFTYTIFDGATGTTQLFTARLTFPTFQSGNYVKSHNTGQFCIHQFGGSNEVTNWEVSTTALKNADFIGLGDSNMHGMFATNNAGRWIESAMTTAGKTFNILAGISDRTSDVIRRLPEVVALKPKVVVLSIGRNDLAGSIPLATVQSNIDQIINTLQNNGITVYLAGVIASNVNVANLQTWYNGKPNVKINAYNATKSASATTLNTSLSSGDGIHLNQAGNTALANLLLTIILPQTPPVAPTNLSAVAVSSSQINLTWSDNSSNETGFQVERSNTPGAGYTLIATTSSNVTSYSSTGLNGNTTYYYRVRAINITSNSGYTNEAGASTPAVVVTPPAAPANLAAVASSATQVNLSWTDLSNNETGFQVERSLSAGSGFALVSSVAANSVTYSDQSLTANTTYYYRVRATNDGGSSSYTAVVACTTPSGVANPGGRRFLIDFGSPSTPTTTTGWNNITSPATGSVVGLIQSNGAGSTASLQIVKDPSNGYGAFSSNGANVVVLDYPVSAVSDGHFGWGSGGTYRINGLDDARLYSFRFFGSRLYVGDSRKSVFTINGVQQVLETTNNTTQTVVFNNIAPVSGSVTIDFTVGSGSQFAYLNVLDITESTAAGARRTTPEPVSDSGVAAIEQIVGLSVYPNPAIDELNVVLGRSTREEIVVQLFDMLGRPVETRHSFTNEVVRIDVSQFAGGIYIVRAGSEWRKVRIR